jgi:hypothetical protein
LITGADPVSAASVNIHLIPYRIMDILVQDGFAETTPPV